MKVENEILYIFFHKRDWLSDFPSWHIYVIESKGCWWVQNFGNLITSRVKKEMLKVTVDIGSLVDSSHWKWKVILRALHILANVVVCHLGILCEKNLQTVLALISRISLVVCSSKTCLLSRFMHLQRFVCSFV